MRLLISGAILLFFSACSSTIQVSSVFPGKTDFSRFDTYHFIAPGKVPSSNFTFTSYQQGVIYDAIARELQQRGYAESRNNDLMVKVQGNISYAHTESNYQYPYNYYPYGRRPWHNRYRGDNTERSLTIIIDLVDVTNQELVWHGEAIQDLKRKDNEAVKIMEAVKAVFEEYPFLAGQEKPIGANPGKW